MAVRKVIQIGNPKLKAENKKITDFKDPLLKKLITDLKDTLRKNGLIGIAGPQIAKNVKIFVTEIRETPSRKVEKADPLRIYINPTVTFFSKRQNLIYEGCGSVVNGKLFGPVKRPEELIIEAFDEHQKKFQLQCDGILARVIQHEYDHLSGIEFLEKVTDNKKFISGYFYRKFIRNSKEQKEASKITLLKFRTV